MCFVCESNNLTTLALFSMNFSLFKTGTMVQQRLCQAGSAR